MVKTIIKVGDSLGIILDSALLELAHLKVGDTVNVEVRQGGTIMLTPVRSVITPDKAGEAAKHLMEKNTELFRRLA